MCRKETSWAFDWYNFSCRLNSAIMASSVREACQETGLNKSTVYRALKGDVVSMWTVLKLCSFMHSNPMNWVHRPDSPHQPIVNELQLEFPF